MEFVWVKRKSPADIFWPGKVIPESEFTPWMTAAWDKSKSPFKTFVKFYDGKGTPTTILSAWSGNRTDLINYDGDQKQTERLIHEGIATLKTLKDSAFLLKRFRTDLINTEIMLLSRIKEGPVWLEKKAWVDKIETFFDSTKKSTVENPVGTSEMTVTSTSIIKTGGSQRIKRKNNADDDNEKNKKKKKSKLQHHCFCGFSSGSLSELVSHATSSHSPKNYTLGLSPEVIDVESPPKKKIPKKKKKKVEVRTEEPTNTGDHSSDESVVLIDSDKQNERGDSQLGVGLGQEIIKSFENLGTNFTDLTEKFRQFIEKK